VSFKKASAMSSRSRDVLDVLVSAAGCESADCESGVIRLAEMSRVAGMVLSTTAEGTAEAASLVRDRFFSTTRYKYSVSRRVHAPHFGRASSHC
jgi:hypothetical protein